MEHLEVHTRRPDLTTNELSTDYSLLLAKAFGRRLERDGIAQEQASLLLLVQLVNGLATQ
jgi:hypothetical protein